MSSPATPPWLHVILYQPEIPPNTGNVMRLCANTGTLLHLVHPLGFELSEKRVRRAGMDYRELVQVREHERLDDALRQVDGRVYALTTRATRAFTDARFASGDALLFGPETRGLPQHMLDGMRDEERLRIPMRPESRSLNLSNAVAVTVYEAWRQLGFAGAAG